MLLIFSLTPTQSLFSCSSLDPLLLLLIFSLHASHFPQSSCYSFPLFLLLIFSLQLSPLVSSMACMPVVELTGCRFSPTKNWPYIFMSTTHSPTHPHNSYFRGGGEGTSVDMIKNREILLNFSFSKSSSFPFCPFSAIKHFRENTKANIFVPTLMGLDESD